jgi:hypothetical protein
VGSVHRVARLLLGAGPSDLSMWYVGAGSVLSLYSDLQQVSDLQHQHCTAIWSVFHQALQMLAAAFSARQRHKQVVYASAVAAHGGLSNWLSFSMEDERRSSQHICPKMGTKPPTQHSLYAHMTVPGRCRVGRTQPRVHLSMMPLKDIVRRVAVSVDIATAVLLQHHLITT